MFLAAEPYGWMEWWGFWFGLASVTLAVVGFVMGWWQIRKVRAAADAAREASEKAVLRVSDRIAMEELSEVRVQLGLLGDALRLKHLARMLREERGTCARILASNGC